MTLRELKQQLEEASKGKTEEAKVEIKEINTRYGIKSVAGVDSKYPNTISIIIA